MEKFKIVSVQIDETEPSEVRKKKLDEYQVLLDATYQEVRGLGSGGSTIVVTHLQSTGGSSLLLHTRLTTVFNYVPK